MLNPLPFEQQPLAVCASPFYVVLQQRSTLDKALDGPAPSWPSRVALLASICHVGAELEREGLHWNTVYADNILLAKCK